MRLIIVSLLCLVVSVSACATEMEEDSTQVVPKQVDTVQYIETGELATTAPVTDSLNYESNLRQNPTKALFKSMVIPGWGQLGNGRKFKAAIYAGLDIWMVASAIHYGNQAGDARDKFENETDLVLRRSLYNDYLDKKDSRNKYTWFAVIVSFISMFDAYVDAHLAGYPKASEPKPLGFDIVPSGEGTPLVSLTYSF